MTQDDEIDILLGDGEDTFTLSEQSAVTSLMVDDAIQAEGSDAAGVIIGESYVLVRTSLFPTMKTGDAVQVNGNAYSVARKMRIQDGKVLQVFLGAANG